MEQKPSTEINSFLATKEIPGWLRSLNVSYSVLSGPYTEPDESTPRSQLKF